MQGRVSARARAPADKRPSPPCCASSSTTSPSGASCSSPWSGPARRDPRPGDDAASLGDPGPAAGTESVKPSGGPHPAEPLRRCRASLRGRQPDPDRGRPALPGSQPALQFQISASRIERASRFVESAGAAIALTTLISSAARYTSADALSPSRGSRSPRPFSTSGSPRPGFTVLYTERFVFHALVRSRGPRRPRADPRSRGSATSRADRAAPEAVRGDRPPSRAGLDHRAPPGRRPGGPRDGLRGASSEATRAMVLDDIQILGREIENQGAAMRGASR